MYRQESGFARTCRFGLIHGGIGPLNQIEQGIFCVHGQARHSYAYRKTDLGITIRNYQRRHLSAQLFCYLCAKLGIYVG